MVKPPLLSLKAPLAFQCTDEVKPMIIHRVRTSTLIIKAVSTCLILTVGQVWAKSITKIISLNTITPEGRHYPQSTGPKETGWARIGNSLKVSCIASSLTGVSKLGLWLQYWLLYHKDIFKTATLAESVLDSASGPLTYNNLTPRKYEKDFKSHSRKPVKTAWKSNNSKCEAREKDISKIA